MLFKCDKWGDSFDRWSASFPQTFHDTVPWNCTALPNTLVRGITFLQQTIKLGTDGSTLEMLRELTQQHAKPKQGVQGRREDPPG